MKWTIRWRLVAAATALVVATAACGSDREGSTPKTPLPKPQTSEVALRPVALPGGVVRDYAVLVPDGAAKAAVVVLDSHAPYLAESARPRRIWSDLAKRLGIIVAIPQGIDDSWNAGGCCLSAAAQGAADVDYLEGIVADLTDEYELFSNQVFLTGWALGGVMAYHVGCVRPGLFAKIAVVDAVLLTKPCRPGSPVDLLHIHQRGDELFPVGGLPTSIVTAGQPLPQLANTFERWLAGHKCRKPVVTVEGPVETTEAACRDKTTARLVVVDGGNGNWPTGPDAPIDATVLISEFFDVAA